jgi:GNAT superfamily N-acetyltransferase
MFENKETHLTLGRAHTSETDQIARVWCDAWHDGHRGHVPDALISARDQPYFDSRAAEVVSNTIVAREGGRIRGLVVVAGTEVQQLMVAADARGRGIAGSLLREAEQAIAATGAVESWLAVVPGNAAARRLYEARGWIDGGLEQYPAPTTTGDVVEVTVHRYTKRITVGAAPLIRPATVDDAASVIALFDQAVEWFQTFGNTGQWGSTPFSSQPRQVERVESWLRHPGGWIAELPGVPVAGVIVLGERHDYVPVVEGDELYVRLLLAARTPEAKGAGRALLAFADGQAASRGVARLRVDCYNGGNGRLPRFYESCGYHRTETFMVREWPGQILERTLPG